MKGTLPREIASKAMAAALAVAGVIVVIWYWRLDDAARATIWHQARDATIWTAFVAILPWATFFVTRWIARRDSNGASAAMLLGYLATNVAFALYLTNGSLGGTWQTAVIIVGFLCAAVYNVLVCELIAERSEDA